MKSAVFASLLAMASAFAPQQQAAQSSTALNAFEGELGVQPPIGFWDPLRLLADADQARFDRLRYVEIKHGRVCMLAFLGNILPRAGIYLPGNIDSAGDKFSDYAPGLAGMFGPDRIPGIGLVQIVLFCGFLEVAVMKDLTGEAEFVGDFRNGYIDFGWDSFDEETKIQKRAIELNNGRAAQMGILGLMVHEVLGTNLPLVGQM